MSTVILLVIVLAFLVLVHELGHFLVAKSSGIDVEEFGLGLPPRAWGRKIGDTLYSLNWIPFGGFVRIAGDDEDSTPGSSLVRPGRGFKEKSFFTKMSVMAGGVLANAYLAFFLIALAFWVGLPVSLESFPNATVRESWVAIVGVLPNTPAAAAGLSLPARVEAISVRGERFSIKSPQNFQVLVRESGGQPVTLHVLSNSEEEIAYTLQPSLPSDGGAPSIGAALDLIGVPDYGPLEATKQAFLLSGHLISGTAKEIALLMARVFQGTGSLEGVSGPVGIAGILASAQSEGLGPFLFIVALISMSLAVINFVPFPALDGGRFLFLVIESLRGRPINPRVSRIVNLVGFLCLILLMLFVTYRDIAHL
jgi:regulator of sigma E protease